MMKLKPSAGSTLLSTLSDFFSLLLRMLLTQWKRKEKKVPPLHTLVKTASDNASSEVRIMSELVYQHQH